MSIVIVTTSLNSGEYSVDINYETGKIVIENNAEEQKILAITNDRATNTYVIEGGETTEIEFPYGAGSYTLREAQLVGKNEPLKILSERVVEFKGSEEVYKGKGYYIDLGVEIPAFQSIEGLNEYLFREYRYDNELDLDGLSYYKPDMQRFVNEKTGICVDYASLMGSILRKVGYQVRFPVGEDTSGNYHMWVEVNENGEWKTYDPTNGVHGELGYSVEKYY